MRRLKRGEKIGLGVLVGAVIARVFTSKGRPVSYPTTARQYKPGSPEQVALFENAAAEVGLPTSWASDPDFVTLLRRESNGMVGIPNYTYGSDIRKHPEKWPLIWEQLRAGIKTTKSSATGLGQLTLPNVDAHYPAQRLGIGDPRNEAIGMLRYIKKRYGSPQAARQFHDENNWY